MATCKTFIAGLATSSSRTVAVALPQVGGELTMPSSAGWAFDFSSHEYGISLNLLSVCYGVNGYSQMVFRILW